MKYSTQVHFCEDNLSNNPFTWVTNNYEIGEMNKWKHNGYLDGFSEWVSWIKQQWPDVECPTLAELASQLKAEYKNSDSFKYKFYQKGSGIGASFAKQEIAWIMNKKVRMGFLKENDNIYLFDLTDYTRNFSEPSEVGIRNWSILGDINQKQNREQDNPVLIENFMNWLKLNNQLSMEEKEFIVRKLL